MPGNGFRQTQTAITALFVQREHNFSLAYPTPVLGKPWSVPFEFPLYQWTAVAVSNVTGMPLIPAGRAVSAVCFYLCLPAVWLLMGRMRLGRTAQWVMLGMMITCPLYIFYARAFLIETMALMFGVWFLFSYVTAVERRSGRWLVVANVAGVGAGLVKITTFIVFLLPAAVWSLWWLWPVFVAAKAANENQARTATDWLRFRQIATWIAGTCALPFVASWWWVRFADAVKAKNPSSENLVSARMHSYNFGTWETRFSKEIWSVHWHIILTNIMPAMVMVATAIVAVLMARRWWKQTVSCIAIFFLVQLLFPILYAWHEYYYVANAGFLMAAAGIALTGLIESAQPRWVVWLVVAVTYAGQIGGYFANQFAAQTYRQNGSSGLADAIRAITQPTDVLLIVGEDWGSMTPFYSERRALMIRSRMENDVPYVEAAFKNLRDESVPLMVVRGSQRENQAFRDAAVAAFDFDPKPAFRSQDADVYLRRSALAAAMEVLKRGEFMDVVVPNQGNATESNIVGREVAMAELTSRQREPFGACSPLPVRVFSKFGFSANLDRGPLFMGAHPDTRLWFQVPPGHRTISTQYMIGEGAYANLAREEATDGVEFVILQLLPTGEKQYVFSKWLNPRDNPADRGVQDLVVEIDVAARAELVFETRPGGTYSRDWAFWGPITIK